MDYHFMNIELERKYDYRIEVTCYIVHRLWINFWYSAGIFIYRTSPLFKKMIEINFIAGENYYVISMCVIYYRLILKSTIENVNEATIFFLHDKYLQSTLTLCQPSCCKSCLQLLLTTPPAILRIIFENMTEALYP